RCRGHRGGWLLRPGRQLRCRARPLRRVGGRGRDRPAARRPRGRRRRRAGRRVLLPHPARPARRGQRHPPGPAAGQPPGGSAYRLPGYLTAWTCVVWATSRSAASYTLVWAVTVVRPRCTGTATARTVPPVTGRNMWLVEVIVAVVLPSGSPRNVTSAPALSASDIRTPPCSTPAVVHRCGAQSRRATTRSAPASSRARPSCPANGISATRASRSADMTGGYSPRVSGARPNPLDRCQVNENRGNTMTALAIRVRRVAASRGSRVAAALAAAALMASLTGAARQPITLYPVQAALGFQSPIVTWGNGTGASPSKVSDFLSHLASYGFTVIASTLPNTGSGNEIDAAAHYLVTQNGVATSVYHGHLNTGEVASVGTSQGAGGAVQAATKDPALIKTVMTFSLPNAIWAGSNPDCPTAADCTANPAALTQPVFFASTYGIWDAIIASPATEKEYFNSTSVHAALGIILTSDGKLAD